MEHSPVMSLVWQIAAIEAADSHYEFIEPEHFFIALCKLEGFANVTRLRGLGVPESQVSTVEAEIDLLMGLFTRYGIQTTSLRHELRQSLGEGGFHPPADADDVMLHRSDESRRAFERAEKVARKKNARVLAIFHLLAGLLHQPGGSLVHWLQKRHINVAGLRQSAETTNLVPGQPRGRPATPPPTITAPATEPLPATPTVPETFVSRYSFNITRHAQQLRTPPGEMPTDILQAVIAILQRPARNNPLILTERQGLVRQMMYHLAWNFLQNPEFSEWRTLQIVQPDLAALADKITYQGEFPDRFQKLLQEITGINDTILFIDNIETIIGSGTVHVDMDAVIDTLVSVLGDGGVQCIGATTPDEYTRYIRRHDGLGKLFTPHQLKLTVPVARIPEPVALETGSFNRPHARPAPPMSSAPPAFIGISASSAQVRQSPLVDHLTRTLKSHLTRFGITLEVSASAQQALAQLAADGQSTRLRETFVSQIENPLGGMILRGEVEYGQTVRVDEAHGEFVVRRMAG